MSPTAQKNAAADTTPTQPILKFTFAPLQYPCTFTLIGLSIIISLAYFDEKDISFAFADWHIFVGQVWRFVTSCFVHGDLVHLAFNLYWLQEFGQPIERSLKPIRMLALVVLLAMGTGACEFLWLGTGGIGMSGILYGFFTMFWVTRKTAIFDYVLSPKTIRILVAWFFICILLTLTDVWVIGNVAHGSGAAIGYLIGAAMRSKRPRRNIAIVSLSVLTITLMTQYMPWHYSWWWNKGYHQSINEQYSKALDSYNRSIALAGNDDLVAALLPTAASLAANHERHLQAIDYYERAIAVSPDPKPLRAYLAYLYFYLGNYPKALENSEYLTITDLDAFLRGIPEFVTLVFDRIVPEPASTEEQEEEK